MTTPSEAKFVCIHGHFYQPPRENPWLDEIEREESATPYHDWNERINSECYRANTAARLVDDRNRILTLHNNYRSLSFNFGPTLMRWLEIHQPWVYKTILDADHESCARMHGHGNGLAQVYNHIIMPLASRRDKVTQVLWGIRDFRHRFRRDPEGMWLAETAVDHETLEVLADAGIKFTILSPFQAGRYRFSDRASIWLDAKGGNIPTGYPYRFQCSNGKAIHLFFYDPAMARGIAFGELLAHSSRLIDQINASYGLRDTERKAPWLVHTATDGESYGHHFKFGDMALAAAFQELDRDPAAQVVSYGSFLASFPVLAEAEILENTAWSCAHGLGRWQADCGCHIGNNPGWTQRWREPLREALDVLRDTLAEHYEREMGRLAADPWKVRDEYVDVLLDPDHRAEDFVHAHARSELTAQSGLHRFFQLLEMQRCSLFMYTSCGWFFDEISGLETTQVLRYAARAIQLAEQTGSSPIEPPFLNILEKAPSNLSEYGNGANVYLKKAKREVVAKDRVAANYAIQSLARSAQRQYRIYAFDIEPQREEDLGSTPAPCLCGRIRVKDRRTREEEGYLYAVLHFGGLDFRCSVKPDTGEGEYELILKVMQQAVEEQNTVKMGRFLDDVWGTSFFSLRDIFRDLRSSIALEISTKTMGFYTDMQSHLFQIHRPLLLSLRQWGIKVPSDLRVAIRRVLSDELTQVVRDLLAHEEGPSARRVAWHETDFFFRAHLGRLHSLMENAKLWGVSLQLSEVQRQLGKALVSTLTALNKSLSPHRLGRLHRLSNVCRELGIKPELWQSQTLYFQLIGKMVSDPGAAGDVKGLRELVKEVDDFLACRFLLLLEKSSALPTTELMIP